MILVTVGMQLGFDRLIEAMDHLAPSLDMEVVAQTGEGDYHPQNMTARDVIAPSEFETLIEQCSVIVSHAGIGTVLTAQRSGKPIVLMPRLHRLGEHRNDHQLATANNLEGRPGILIAFDETELGEAIREALAMSRVTTTRSATANELHSAIGRFIEGGAL